MEAGAFIRRARREAGLTQAELARRLGKRQATVATLERPGSNPTVATLDRVLNALGRRLELQAVGPSAEVDEQQIAAQLQLTPDERSRRHDRAYAEVRATVRAARRVT